MARSKIEDLLPDDLPEPTFAAAPEKQFQEQPEQVAEQPCPWNADMTAAPRNGTVILVTESLSAPDGVKALWYRALGEGRPWLKPPEGWLQPISRTWLTFQPVGWALVPNDAGAVT